MESQPLEKDIWVMCPTCKKTGAVPVDRHVVEGALEQQGDSLLHLHVFSGDISEHAFMVTVDANLKVRQATILSRLN